MAYQKILIVIQGKQTDEEIVRHAADLAQEVEAQITLLRVIMVAADVAGGLGKQFQTEVGSRGWRLSKQAKVSIENFENQLHTKALSVESEILISDGSESDEIIFFALEGGYDLVVMAAEVGPWWQRLLFGCPADSVYRKSVIPTLFLSRGNGKARKTRRQVKPNNPIMEALGTPSL